jgi:hypothetical protein
MSNTSNYKKAYDILDRMLDKSDDSTSDSYGYYNNNIIAFCGNAGHDKEQAVTDFVNEVYNCSKHGDSSLGDISDKIENTFFAKPIVIDPFMFEDSDNIITVVLAEMFQRFKRVAESGIIERESSVGNATYQRQELLNIFDKTFRSMQTLSSKRDAHRERYYDPEDGYMHYGYDSDDYDSNLQKLSRLSNGASMQDNMKELVSRYLRYMDTDNSSYRDCNRKLILVIDNLYSCDENVHKISEQIRKYLMLPNVIIVMALELEQFQMGIAENDYENFRRSLDRGDSGIHSMVNSMSSRYLEKLVPVSNRVYI